MAILSTNATPVIRGAGLLVISLPATPIIARLQAMAERGRAPEGQFYVYELSDGKTVQYVGKGTGRRLKNQIARFGLFGEIVKRFRSERVAYAFEARLIARTCPPLNRASGGGGAITRRKAKLPLWFRREIEEIERVGSRLYVARELSKMGISLSV